MGKSDYRVIVDSGHGFGGDHGIDHRFLRSLDGGKEDGIQLVVRQHFQIVKALWIGCPRVGG